MYSDYNAGNYNAGGYNQYPTGGLGDVGGGKDDKLAKVKDPLLATVRWLKRRSPREKLILSGAGAILVSRPAYQ